ncbi:MAG: hypothetical protein J2P39_04695 [Candidatus Dormibacteraeota bacterium]|nr:hypothetical protein [Candidatus Dormibacteraeota bacterium]
MNDCLQLPPRPGGGGTRRLVNWEATWLPLGEGEAEGLAKGGGEGWSPITVPEQQWAEEDRTAIWYRTVFPRPDVDGRVILRVGGAFLGTNVWLNGRFLGSHYGYFAPFGFDVTPYLRDGNLLVVCCESPIETDLTKKRHVMGIFNDGDSRPYPSSTWFSLPDEYHWRVPIGLWAPVELEYTGPVVLESAQIRPHVEAGDVGRVELTAHLRNLDGREMTGEVVFDLECPDAPPLRLRRELTLSGASERTVQMALTVMDVQRWLPWRLGRQALYTVRLTVVVRGRVSVRWDDRFGFRDAWLHAGPEGWEVTARGRPFFVRGADYIPSLQLDQLNEEAFAADLRVARDANLDLLRVPGAVLPEAFYRLCDEVGMLVIADFPLTRSYAYHADAEETRFFEQAVRAQVPELVGQLANRPSIALWVAHDDPPWIEANSALGDVHAVRQNYTIDQEVKATLESLDRTRPALAASGEFDQHLWLGWKEGSWHHFADVLPRFVTAFGAQALPPAGSPDWSALKARWPVSGDDATWLFAGYQSPHWAEHGIGLTEDYESLEDYVDASHEYQAWLLSYAIDQFRKRKFEPCWGALLFTLVDPFPGVGFGLLDSSRNPRPALAAVREAFSPLRLILDPIDFSPLVPFGVGWHPEDEISVRLVVVNDDPLIEGDAEIHWTVVRDRPLEGRGVGRLFDGFRRKSSGGTLTLTLPTAEEPALQVETLSLPIDAEGDYTFSAELRLPDREPLVSELLFRIADRLDNVRRRPLLPGYLAGRIVVDESLVQSPEGFQFTLRNRTQPAILTALGEVRLDGEPIPNPRLLLATDAGRLPLPRRVELPLERDVVIFVEVPAPLEVRGHELEVDLTLPGIASGRVRVHSPLGTPAER